MTEEVQVTLGRHHERITDLEKRDEERRLKQDQIFEKMDTLSENMSDLKGKVSVWGPILLIIVTVLANMAVKFL